MKPTLATALALVLPVLAAAAPAPAAKKPSAKPAEFSSARSGRANYRISFNLKAADLQSTGSFVVRDGEKGSYLWGGEKPYVDETKSGSVVDFKKFSTVATCTVAAEPGGKQLALECQFELAGALAPEGEGTLKSWPVATFQYAAPFTMDKGQTITLVDDTQHHIDVHVEELGRALPPDRAAPVKTDEPTNVKPAITAPADAKPEAAPPQDVKPQ